VLCYQGGVYDDFTVLFADFTLRAVKEKLRSLSPRTRVNVLESYNPVCIDMLNVDAGFIAVKLDIPAGQGVASDLSVGLRRRIGCIVGDGDALFLSAAADQRRRKNGVDITKLVRCGMQRAQQSAVRVLLPSVKRRVFK